MPESSQSHKSPVFKAFLFPQFPRYPPFCCIFSLLLHFTPHLIHSILIIMPNDRMIDAPTNLAGLWPDSDDDDNTPFEDNGEEQVRERERERKRERFEAYVYIYRTPPHPHPHPHPHQPLPHSPPLGSISLWCRPKSPSVRLPLPQRQPRLAWHLQPLRVLPLPHPPNWRPVQLERQECPRTR